MTTFYTNVYQLGNHILFRGVENGKRVKLRIPYKPKLYVKAKAGAKTKFCSLFREPLEEIAFESIYEARDFTKQYKEVSNFKIYGNQNYIYQFISDEFGGVVDFDVNKILIGYIDIEVGSEAGFPDPAQANQPITAITLLLGKTYFVFGCGDFKIPEGRTDIKYLKCENEQVLLEKFIEFWSKNTPDIISGWNIGMFDFPYIINRLKRLFMEELANRLSPWGKLIERNTHMGAKEIQFYDIGGVAMLDYIELYKKFAKNPNQESYQLNHIANVEVGETKLDYSEFENLHTLYLRDYQKFIEYNIHDVYLVSKIEDKIRLIELAITLAYDNKVNFEDVFMQVRMWDSICYNALRKENIIVPPKDDHKKYGQNIGAYVKDPVVGMHKWGVSWDLDGLYPHLIMMYNMSPETLVNHTDLPLEVLGWFNEYKQRITVDALATAQIPTELLKKHNLTMTPNGAFFTREFHGFLPRLMESMYEDRKNYKNRMLQFQQELENEKDPEKRKELEKNISKNDNFQSVKKITLNSAYGALANEYFRLFDIRVAEGITTAGQLSVKWIEQKVNNHLNKMLKTDVDYIIAMDTDSIYISFGPIIEKFVDESKVEKLKISETIDQFCEKNLQPFIDTSFKELNGYVNAYAHKMRMKREAIFDRAIWTAKKRYILNVYNNEGVQYAKPKLKIKGLEAIKSSTPQVIRGKMKQAFEIIMTKDESALIDFVDTFRQEFKKLPVEDVASPRGCNGLLEYSDEKTIWGFKTPFHVKGALLFNHLLKSHKVTKKYQEIKEGEKIKYMYLKEPNTVQTNVISFTSSLPKEFELHQYLDYDTQFNKVFVDPLMIVLRAIDWELDRSSSLESLFG